MKNRRKKILSKQKIEACKLCGCNLYEGSKCYYLQKQYFCEKCVGSAHIELDKKEQIGFDEKRIKNEDFRKIPKN